MNGPLELAEELLRLKVDLILISGDPAVRAAMNATKTIPIVLLGAVLDPVEQVSLKALPVLAATSLALLHTLTENYTGSGWNCSKKPFQNLPVSRFSTIRP